MNAKQAQYIFWGVVNTAFGYVISLLLYYSLSPRIALILIAILINIVNITFSFITYKAFVFKSKEDWWREYFRAYIVYGGSAIIGIILLLLFVDFLQIKFWIAQALLIFVSATISFLGHDRFTFKKGKMYE